MISLKRYLSREGDESALSQMVATLLERIGSGAIVGDRSEYEAFQAEIESLLERVGPEASPEMLILNTGFATQALETYNKTVSRFLRQKSRTMHSIVKLMTESVVGICGEHAASSGPLRELVDRLEKASDPEELEALKGSLGECLELARDEALGQKQQADTLIQALREEIERGPAPQRPYEPADFDAATGLPMKDSAMKAMSQPIGGGKRRYAVVMVVNRIQP